MRIYILLILGVVSLTIPTIAQQTTSNEQKKIEYSEFKKKLNESGSHYIKATLVGQIWSRYTDFNPGSTLNGYTKQTPFDIGIRRARVNFLAQPTDRIFFYAQFGQNNFNLTSKLYTGAFIHDFVGEYKIHAKLLSIGTGLSGWSGLTRFSSPGAGSILGVDAPLYQQVTNGMIDQFLRKLSIYAKGKIGKLDYRLALTNPMTFQSSPSYDASKPASSYISTKEAKYSLMPPHLQTQGYLNYQFFDQEDNTLAYTAGTYHGKKKILNIGAGWIHQKGALWHQDVTNGDTTVVSDNMTLLGADVFFEMPLSSKRNAITVYSAFTDYQMGKNYIRNLGVMNPSTGVSGTNSLAGGGNAVPLIGTGQTIFTQIAYKFRDNLLPEQGSIQIYASAQISKYQALKDNMMLYEGGVNWLINGDHHSKLTLTYQSRPIFYKDSNGDNVTNSRRGMAVLQYQISL